jgi:hypothetical protein
LLPQANPATQALLTLQRDAGNQAVSHAIANDHDNVVVQRVRFGTDGPLDSAQRATVRAAAAIAEAYVMTPAFATIWNRFWSNPANAGMPRPNLRRYQAAVHDRWIHLMDTSSRAQVRAEATSAPAVTYTLAPEVTWVSAAAIARGPDAVVNLLLHESLHGAGVPEGPGGIPLFEGALQDLTTQAGFPIDQGGAVIHAAARRIGRAVHLLGTVQISRNPTSPPHLHVVQARDGSVVQDQVLSQTIGTFSIDITASFSRHQRYAVRVRDGRGMMGSTTVRIP